MTTPGQQAPTREPSAGTMHTLFELDPIRVPPPGTELVPSAGRRLTLRNNESLARGVHPATRKPVAANGETRHGEPAWPGPVDGIRPWVSMAEALGWGMTARPYPSIATGTGAGGTDPACVGGTGARRSIHTERDQGRWLNTGRDWPEGGTRGDAQTVPDDRPAPTLTAKAGGQWQWTVQTGQNSARADGQTVLYERDVEAPAPTLTSQARSWTVDRPATTVVGDSRLWPPGHKVNADDRARLGDDEAADRYGDRAGTGAIRLTVRDALILQSFRADYPVTGTKTKQFEQIGNAVPPLLAAHILAMATGAQMRHEARTAA